MSKVKYSIVAVIAVGTAIGSSLAFKFRARKILYANAMAIFANKPVGYQEMPLAIITHVISISPELGNWLMRINHSHNGHGWYPDPKRPEWMRIQYGLTDLALLVKDGRALKLRVGNQSYPIASDLWSKLEGNLIFQP